MVPPLWEGTLLLFNPWTHGFLTSIQLKYQMVHDERKHKRVTSIPIVYEFESELSSAFPLYPLPYVVYG